MTCILFITLCEKSINKWDLQVAQRIHSMYLKNKLAQLQGNPYTELWELCVKTSAMTVQPVTETYKYWNTKSLRKFIPSFPYQYSTLKEATRYSFFSFIPILTVNTPCQRPASLLKSKTFVSVSAASNGKNIAFRSIFLWGYSRAQSIC